MNKQERRVWFFERLSLTIKNLSEQGFHFMPYDFYRSPQEEVGEYSKGNSSIKVGLHQVWQAMDLVEVIKGELNWKDGPSYAALDIEARRNGLSTGRGWIKPHDPNHVESLLGWIDLGIIKG